MRAFHLSALLAPLALSLSFAAQADWPAGTRDTYMNDCLATASQSVDAKQAKAHCECGADVIEKKFSTEEIKALNDRQTPPSDALRQRLVQAVGSCSSDS